MMMGLQVRPPAAAAVGRFASPAFTRSHDPPAMPAAVVTGAAAKRMPHPPRVHPLCVAPHQPPLDRRSTAAHDSRRTAGVSRTAGALHVAASRAAGSLTRENLRTLHSVLERREAKLRAILPAPIAGKLATTLASLGDVEAPERSAPPPGVDADGWWAHLRHGVGDRTADLGAAASTKLRQLSDHVRAAVLEPAYIGMCCPWSAHCSADLARELSRCWLIYR